MMSRCLSCAGPDGFHEPHCQQERDSLRAENARLQERVEEAEEQIQVSTATGLRIVQERNEARALAERRKKALMEYGNHHSSCILEHHAPGVRDCGCGYIAALRAAIEEEDR